MPVTHSLNLGFPGSQKPPATEPLSPGVTVQSLSFPQRQAQRPEVLPLAMATVAHLVTLPSPLGWCLLSIHTGRVGPDGPESEAKTAGE